MAQTLPFDSAKARTYRRRGHVLAFKTDADFTFHKSWAGPEGQQVDEGGWVMVPLDAADQPVLDVYGCASKQFTETYAPAGPPNRYKKTETIRAYQPGHPFKTENVVDRNDGSKKKEATEHGSDVDWYAQNPGGETYIIEDARFRQYYELASEDAQGEGRRVLVLEGNGVRGLATLQFLLHLEHQLDAAAFEAFDVVVGTGWGALMAARVALGFRARKLITRYRGLLVELFAADNAHRERMLQRQLALRFADRSVATSGARTELVLVPPAGPPVSSREGDPEGERALSDVVRVCIGEPPGYAPPPPNLALLGLYQHLGTQPVQSLVTLSDLDFDGRAAATHHAMATALFSPAESLRVAMRTDDESLPKRLRKAFEAPGVAADPQRVQSMTKQATRVAKTVLVEGRIPTGLT